MIERERERESDELLTQNEFAVRSKSLLNLSVAVCTLPLVTRRMHLTNVAVVVSIASTAFVTCTVFFSV